MVRYKAQSLRKREGLFSGGPFAPSPAPPWQLEQFCLNSASPVAASAAETYRVLVSATCGLRPFVKLLRYTGLLGSIHLNVSGHVMKSSSPCAFNANTCDRHNSASPNNNTTEIMAIKPIEKANAANRLINSCILAVMLRLSFKIPGDKLPAVVRLTERVSSYNLPCHSNI